MTFICDAMNTRRVQDYQESGLARSAARKRNTGRMLNVGGIYEKVGGTMTNETTIYITEVDLARLRKLIEVARDTGGDSNTALLE